MKIITCYKCVPDEQDIAVNNADGSLDFSKADAKISQYDLNAIEATSPHSTHGNERMKWCYQPINGDRDTAQNPTPLFAHR